jgi:hypothetical protein
MEISNGEALTHIFGRWPSFHDAEVIALRLDRGPSEGDTPSLELDIHLWEMTSDVDPNGFYVLRHHTITTLRFADIDDLDLSGFNGQNVIAKLTINGVEANRRAVDLATSYGLSVGFNCANCEVVRAEPHNPD